MSNPVMLEVTLFCCRMSLLLEMPLLLTMPLVKAVLSVRAVLPVRAVPFVLEMLQQIWA